MSDPRPMIRLLLLVVAVVLAGCDSEPVAVIVEGTATDIPTGSGDEAIYVSLRAAAEGEPPVLPPDVAATAEWDVSFDGAAVRLNGGSSGPGVAVGVVVGELFASIVDALREDRAYRRDGDSPCASGPPRVVCRGSLLVSEGGAVVPVLGRVLLLRLADGRGYAKVRIEAVTEGPAGEPQLTLRYAVNPDGAVLGE